MPYAIVSYVYTSHVSEKKSRFVSNWVLHCFSVTLVTAVNVKRDCERYCDAYLLQLAKIRAASVASSRSLNERDADISRLRRSLGYTCTIVHRGALAPPLPEFLKLKCRIRGASSSVQRAFILKSFVWSGPWGAGNGERKRDSYGIRVLQLFLSVSK